jgi:hypothetical protein
VKNFQVIDLESESRLQGLSQLPEKQSVGGDYLQIGIGGQDLNSIASITSGAIPIPRRAALESP